MSKKEIMGTNRPNVLVVLLNYNTTSDTLYCLRSIQESSIRPFVVIVDNASNEPITQSDVAFYGEHLHLIQNDENVGFGGGNNIGIRWGMENTDASYFFILNNDTEVETDTIRILLRQFDRDPAIGLATSLIVFMDNPGVVWYGGGELSYKKGNPRILDFRKAPTLEGALKSKEVTFASGCSMMVKREVLEKVGLFDKRFFMYIEDMELCYRIIKAGYKMYYTSETKIYHKVHGSSRRDDRYIPPFDPRNEKMPFYVYHFFKNTLVTMNSHLGMAEKLRFYSYYLPFSIHRFLLFSAKGKWKGVRSIARAYLHFFIGKNEKS